MYLAGRLVRPICDRSGVKAFVAGLRDMPMLARCVSIGAISAGVTGGIVGLVVGLFAYAPTAPVAAVELGFPATLTGVIVGFVVGVIVITAGRIKHVAQNGCCRRLAPPP
jgi:hypothetical protein